MLLRKIVFEKKNTKITEIKNADMFPLVSIKNMKLLYIILKDAINYLKIYNDLLTNYNI